MFSLNSSLKIEILLLLLMCLLIPLLKVCERSLSGSGSGPNPAAAAQFVRAETLPSGYLIRPCEGGGSIIHIVDHLNLEVLLLNTGLMHFISFLIHINLVIIVFRHGASLKCYGHFMNHQRWWLRK